MTEEKNAAKPVFLKPLHPSIRRRSADPAENPTLPLPTSSIAEAGWPKPFAGGIEYSPPARGPWTIVHIGMLLPEMHEIFVCAQACLRGVVLSAAEMQVQDRFSTITVTEEHFRDGRLEETMIEGTTHILNSLEKRPKAVLLYTSCVHHFTGADVEWAMHVLKERFPDVVFIDAYMTPTFRKSEMPPDNKMRMQLYAGLERPAQPAGGLLLAGTLEPFGAASYFAKIAARAGVPFYELAGLERWDDYLAMANAALAVTINPAAKQAGDLLEERLRLKCLSLSLSYDEAEIDAENAKVAAALGLDPNAAELLEAAEAAKRGAREALDAAREALDGRAVAICQSATTRPLGLARRLLDAGICVTDIFADGFLTADKPDYEALRRTHPALRIHPITSPEMRFAPRDFPEGLVAVGQKAAWFTGAKHMVNLIEGGPLWGHEGVAELARRIAQASKHETDVAAVIRIKGYGCLGGVCESEAAWI